MSECIEKFIALAPKKSFVASRVSVQQSASCEPCREWKSHWPTCTNGNLINIILYTIHVWRIFRTFICMLMAVSFQILLCFLLLFCSFSCREPETVLEQQCRRCVWEQISISCSTFRYTYIHSSFVSPYTELRFSRASFWLCDEMKFMHIKFS